MCVSCGCLIPENQHADSRNITLTDLRGAAEAAGLTVQDAAANVARTVAKCCAKSRENDEDAIGVVIKADPSKQFLLTVAYPAWKPDVAVAADGHIDFASDHVLEDACWYFMRKGAKVGMWHEPGHENEAEVVENYIYRREDPWVIKSPDGNDQVVMFGDWLVGLRLSNRAWSLWKARLIGGVSPQGGAKRRLPSPESLARVRSRMNA